VYCWNKGCTGRTQVTDSRALKAKVVRKRRCLKCRDIRLSTEIITKNSKTRSLRGTKDDPAMVPRTLTTVYTMPRTKKVADAGFDEEA
jgi:hypothetical protein